MCKHNITPIIMSLAFDGYLFVGIETIVQYKWCVIYSYVDHEFYNRKVVECFGYLLEAR